MGRVSAFSTFCLAPTEEPLASMRQGEVHFVGTVADFVGPGVVRWHTVDTIVGGTGRFCRRERRRKLRGHVGTPPGIVDGTCDYRITH